MSPSTFIWPTYVNILVLLFEELFSERGSNVNFPSTMSKAELSRRELKGSTGLGKLNEDLEVPDNGGQNSQCD